MGCHSQPKLSGCRGRVLARAGWVVWSIHIFNTYHPGADMICVHVLCLSFRYYYSTPCSVIDGGGEEHSERARARRQA